MKFKRQIFGFMDMLKFKKMVPTRKAMLDAGSNKELPTSYKTNTLANLLHPGFMQVELVGIKKLTSKIKEFTFERKDGEHFPFFKAGSYVSLQTKIGESLASRPYSIVSSPKDALNNKLVLAIESVGFFSNYMCKEAKVGDLFVMSEPSGEFHHETLRDSKAVVGIAGGSGITPFMSMAKAINENSEDFSMTLFYGCKNLKSLAYKDELDSFVSDKFKVIYVLEEETEGNYEKGFITADLLKKYVDIKNSTFFLCGPTKMYDFILKELKEYDLPKKAIRKDSSCCPDLAIKNPKEFNLTVNMGPNTYEIKCYENETLLVALERAGLNAPNKCRAGGCGFCHAKLIKGEYIVAANRDGRREADIKFNCIHPCVTYPKTDMIIEVPSAY